MIKDLQLLIDFLARRDLTELSVETLERATRIKQVDAIVLLGNSIPSSISIATNAVKNGLAKTLLIAGGVGHSTQYLYDNLKKFPAYSCTFTDTTPEAIIFAELAVSHFGIHPDQILTETRSTNCGANAIEAYRVMEQQRKNWQSIILIQDPTMQLRSHLSFTKHWPQTEIISFAPFHPNILKTESGFGFDNHEVDGLWQPVRFIDIIMGEIPRLRNDELGYGSKGKNFISDIEIPQSIEDAYARLLQKFPEYNQIKLRQ